MGLRSLLAGFLLLTAVVLVAADLPSQPTEQVRRVETVDPVELPKMSVNSARMEDYPLIPKTDLHGGGLSDSEPPVYLMFPGSAYAAGVPVGSATVCIEIDEQGRAIDYLLVAYTEKYFGEALLRNARDTRYQALRFRGVPVSSRFNFGYEFKAEFTVPMSNFDAVERRQLQIRGGRPDFKYHPVTAAALDEPLEKFREAVPYFPDGYAPTGDKADWVMVTLYIDEEGNVRVPHVESASSPLLVHNALRAVHYWKFRPPTVKGKPALVYAAFAVGFVASQ